MFKKHYARVPLYMKRRDSAQTHTNRVLFISRWFGCLEVETCPTDHRVKSNNVLLVGSINILLFEPVYIVLLVEPL